MALPNPVLIPFYHSLFFAAAVDEVESFKPCHCDKFEEVREGYGPSRCVSQNPASDRIVRHVLAEVDNGARNSTSSSHGEFDASQAVVNDLVTNHQPDLVRDVRELLHGLVDTRVGVLCSENMYP